MAISLTEAWTRTVVTEGAPTGIYRGADGVAEDSEHCWVTAWEESGIVTRACPDGGGWVTELVAQGLAGPEDAKAADLDGDGVIDVAIAADSGARVYVTFRDAGGNTTITLGASQGHGHVMQVGIADVDADGDRDIVFGSRVGSPAVIAWLSNPGPSLARTQAEWTYHAISSAGWAMSVVPLDVNADGRIDVVVSDRSKLADGTWGLYGARWMEQLGDGTWVVHPISAPAGSCSPYASTTCTKTPGDEMLLSIAGSTVVGGESAATQPDSRITVHGDWGVTHTTLPPAANVGHYQGALAYDVDGDGDLDIVVTTWKGNAYPVTEPDASKSGLYWMRNNGDGTYARGEISGPSGGKFDNAERLGTNCIITSEQLDPRGGLGVVQYCIP
jgi:hypothetical protein